MTVLCQFCSWLLLAAVSVSGISHGMNFMSRTDKSNEVLSGVLQMTLSRSVDGRDYVATQDYYLQTLAIGGTKNSSFLNCTNQNVIHLMDKHLKWGHQLQSFLGMTVHAMVSLDDLHTDADSCSVVLHTLWKSTDQMQGIATSQTRIRSLRSVNSNEKSILVVRVVLGVKGPNYCSTECANTTIWGDVNTILRSESNNRIALSTDKGRIVTVGLDTRDSSVINAFKQCSVWNIAMYTNIMTRAQRFIEPEQFHHIIYMLPIETNCTWLGTALYDCNQMGCPIWLRTASSVTIHHEIGHNLGLLHAGIDRDDDGEPEMVYGDATSVMGHTDNAVGFNAVQRWQLGWYNENAVYRPHIDRGMTKSMILGGYNVNHSDSWDWTKLFILPRSKGGSYFLSYYSGAGSDHDLPERYFHTVLVHYEPHVRGPLRCIGVMNIRRPSMTLGVFSVTLSRVDSSYESVTLSITKSFNSADTIDQFQIEHARVLPNCTTNVNSSEPCIMINSSTSSCGGVTINFDEANVDCDNAGGRLCEINELYSLGQTPCEDDFTVWTITPCDEDSYLTFQIGDNQSATCMDKALVASHTICCRGLDQQPTTTIAATTKDVLSSTPIKSTPSTSKPPLITLAQRTTREIDLVLFESTSGSTAESSYPPITEIIIVAILAVAGGVGVAMYRRILRRKHDTGKSNVPNQSEIDLEDTKQDQMKSSVCVVIENADEPCSASVENGCMQRHITTSTQAWTDDSSSFQNYPNSSPPSSRLTATYTGTTVSTVELGEHQRVHDRLQNRWMSNATSAKWDDEFLPIPATEHEAIKSVLGTTQWNNGNEETFI